MNQYYLINEKNIKKYLSSLDKKKPGRTLCGLDLINDNIEKNLKYALSKDQQLMVEVDHTKKEATILGDDIPSKERKIVFDKEKNNESIYNTFIAAIDYVKQTEGGEDMIKEIKSKINPETVKENASTSAKLNDINRLAVAKKLPGLENITHDQEKAILASHNVGASREGAGVYKYAQAEITQKAKILDEAGLTVEQRRNLMENGITGEIPQYASDIERVRDMMGAYENSSKFVGNSFRSLEFEKKIAGVYKERNIPTGELQIHHEYILPEGWDYPFLEKFSSYLQEVFRNDVPKLSIDEKKNLTEWTRNIYNQIREVNSDSYNIDNLDPINILEYIDVLHGIASKYNAEDISFFINSDDNNCGSFKKTVLPAFLQKYNINRKDQGYVPSPSTLNKIKKILGEG